MKILDLFTKKEHENEYEFADEDYVFQHCHKRYYVRKIHGIAEFWCRSVLDPEMNFFLGKLINQKIVLSKAFYTHPWDVQKGGAKLCRIYLHNDWRE